MVAQGTIYTDADGQKLIVTRIYEPQADAEPGSFQSERVFEMLEIEPVGKFIQIWESELDELDQWSIT